MAGLLQNSSRNQNAKNEQGSTRWVLSELFELLKSEAERDGDPASQALRQQTAELGSKVDSTVDPRGLTTTATACLEACRHYLAARWEREAAYRNLVEVLTESVASVAAETGVFAEQMTNASNRVGALTDLEDIQVLKQRLTQEVGEIRQVVLEKKRQDKTLQARLDERIKTLESSLAESQVAATTDPLTGVANRRHLGATLERCIAMRRASGEPFVLAIIDCDSFKQINDTYGHQAGDAALIGISTAVSESLRPSDLVARYGGDEFVLLMMNMTLEQAENRLPQIVAKVAAKEFQHEKDGVTRAFRLTISCGFTQFVKSDSAESLLARADEGLYAAKQQGQGCAVGKRASLLRGIFR